MLERAQAHARILIVNPARLRQRCSFMRARTARGGITRTRTAASSIASGKPSRSRTSVAIAVLSSAFGSKSGFAAFARRTNSSLPSWVASGASARTSSPGKPSTSRVVARNRASGAALSHRPTVESAWRATCSKLSSTTRQRPRRAMAWPSWTTGSSFPRGTSRPCATACKMPSKPRVAVRSQNQTPPAQLASALQPKRVASRVLPPLSRRPFRPTIRSPSATVRRGAGVRSASLRSALPTRPCFPPTQ